MGKRVFILSLIVIAAGAVPCWSQEQSPSGDIHELIANLSVGDSRLGGLFDVTSQAPALDNADNRYNPNLDYQGLNNHYRQVTPASPSEFVERQSFNRPILLAAFNDSVIAAESQEDEKRWSSFLPLMGEEVRKRGYELHLPFGASINFLLLKRDIEVTEVEAGLNSDPAPVQLDLAVISKTAVSNVTARFDAWILPFLNLYLLACYTQSESRVNVQFTIPVPGPVPDVPVDLDIEGSVEGPTLGGGLTLAAGYQHFFLTGGTNFTYTDLGGIFDEAVNAIVVTARTGWNGPVGNTHLAVWIGGTYWDTEREVTGSIPVGGNTINFKVVQGPVNPANLNFGANVEITKKFSMAV